MRSVLCVFLVLGLVSTAGAQQSVTFEPPAYTAGLPVVGQDGWTCCIAGSDSSGFIVDNVVVSPMSGSTQSLKIVGVSSGNRIGRNWGTPVSAGVWRVGYDWRYTGNDGVTPDGSMFMTTPMYRADNQQIMQPYMQDGDGGSGTGGASVNAFTCTGPLGGGGFAGRGLGLPGVTKNKWYRLEMVMDFDQKIILDLNLYDISSGSKVLLGNNPGTFYFNYASGSYVSQFDKLGIRFDKANPALAWWIDNYSITPTTLPAPIIGSPPLYANVNVPFSKAVTLANPQPVTWALNFGPPGAVIDPNTGVISGWTPVSAGAANFSVTATNTYGAVAQKDFTVTVIGQYDLALIPFDAQIDTGAGPAITPASQWTFEPPDDTLDNFGRFHLYAGQGGGGWYYSVVDFTKAGFGTINISSCYARMNIDVRYYQEQGTYADAPVVARFYDTAGKVRSWWFHRDTADVHYPTWQHHEVYLNNNTMSPPTAGWFDADFNPAAVTKVEFFGTDWSGTGNDYVDLNNLVISNDPVLPVVDPVIPSLETAFVGSSYTKQLTVRPCTNSWSLVSNAPGATISNSGLVSGFTPTAGQIGQTFNFSATATNGAGSANVSWQAVVKPIPVADSGIAQPWGTVHANISGTQSSNAASLILQNDWANGAKIDWTLNVTSLGLDRPFERVSSITFDEVGNLYWKSRGSSGYLASASPDGTLRWVGNVNGTNQSIGSGDKSSPVVGDQGMDGRVYVLTDSGAAAFSKLNGDRVWNTDLAGTNFAGTGDVLTPVLYNGKLYVLGAGTGTKKLYQLNSTTGSIEWSSDVTGCTATNGGQMTLVPNAFGAGVHGLYYNADGGNATNKSMFAIAINTGTNSATLQWSSAGGKVARSHVIYVEAAGRVCTHTWNDYGSSLYCWNLDGSAPAQTVNPGEAWHGFEDFGAVDFDGNDIIAGGFSGRIARYLDVATPGVLTPPATVVYDSGGFEALTLGSIVGQDSWAEDTSGGYPQAEIISDPTGGGHGKVLVLDPPGTAGGWQGVVRAAPITPGAAVTMEWDQWRADNSDNFWVADNAAYDGWWAIGWDSSGTLSVANTFGGGVTLTPGKWQHVKYTFDPGDGSVTLDVDGVTARAGTADTALAGIDFEVEPTAAGTPAEGGPMYIDNIVIKQGPASAPPPFGGTGWYQLDVDYGENRGVGGLYQNEAGKSIYVASTSSSVYNNQILGFNVTDAPMYTAAPPQPAQPRLFEFDTLGTANPCGGPLLGPVVAGTQHIYYFKGDSGDLVALRAVRYAPPDLNRDGKVNRDDFLLFAPCATRAEVDQADSNCQAADFDGDGDVDMDDFGGYQQCFSGEADADPDCYP